MGIHPGEPKCTTFYAVAYLRVQVQILVVAIFPVFPQPFFFYCKFIPAKVFQLVVYNAGLLLYGANEREESPRQNVYYDTAVVYVNSPLHAARIH